jgi:TM2 domain-containing membrane protein YozV
MIDGLFLFLSPIMGYVLGYRVSIATIIYTMRPGAESSTDIVGKPLSLAAHVRSF